MPARHASLSRPLARSSEDSAGQSFKKPTYPADGWLRSTRQALGLTLQTVADRLDVSPQAVHQFEKSEAAGTIGLRQLQNVAGAMGCRVEYAVFTPKSSEGVPPPVAVLGDPTAKPAPTPVDAGTPEREQSLLLENQAAGRFD